ncbi:LPXTG cell wall anchor domain-containing protein [Micromonospora sp. C31]|uniref:LPXTG cell wall anchor domain-containing protein n=1 Tax=Micromonospora sp. C31 TaxID=2824876 RepID=UPI001B36EE17|nr:LPXTG cell wall anchor domain-containing protein [Micromonospora sp. C31]MBQ1072574.1 LPXTG cell wall anchor domain-containing protein [Micromonospora sp. C31]
MIFRNRSLARIGAGALLASGALTVLGSPAHASGTETDLAIEVAGTRVAANAEGKFAFAKVTNLGKNTPSELAVRVDVSKVDFDKVQAWPAVEDGCDMEGTDKKPTAFVCYATEKGLPGPGETVDLPIVLFKAEVKGTYQAPLSFKLVSKDDTNAANDTKTATLDLSDASGPDLSVVAEDVKQAVKVVDGNPVYSGDLHAGGRSALTYFIRNQGDKAAAGLKISVKLPKGVTPTEVEPGCEYAADKSTFTCTYANFGLIPQDEDTNAEDKLYSAYGFYHLFDVAADVKPGALKGGLVSVEPIVSDSSRMRAAAVTLPENVTGLRATDVDASDNSDGYAVVVAAKGGAGGGGDDDGGLPVTGAQTTLIGGVGGAVLVAGAVMFMVARRRRVVLVTPGDEKPTA